MVRRFDFKNHIFPIFIGPFKKEGIPKEVEFLGTGFFVTSNGIAITANHCLPKPEQLNNKCILIGIWDNGNIKLQKVFSHVRIPSLDIAILKIDNIKSKKFNISYEELKMGTPDVFSIGFPWYSIWGEPFEVRFLKGYITRVTKYYELSFAIPRGMSGSPLFREDKLIGVLVMNAKSETLEDEVSEIIQVTNQKERIEIVKTKSIINYGLAIPFAKLSNFKDDTLDGLSFEDYIKK